MRSTQLVAAIFLVFLSKFAFGESPVKRDTSVARISDYEISVKKSDFERHCVVDQKLIDIKLSSDGQAAIISGTSYISMSELIQCNPKAVIHAKLAAPRVGFLSDVNLRAGVYASLVPVAVNPMSFVAVVAKIGGERNIVNLPGFYRKGVSTSRLLSEASSSISPVISLDAHYVSLDLHSCEVEGDVEVIDMRSNKRVRLDRASCEKLFTFQ